MKTIYYGASSLNGFIADSNNSLDWLFQFHGEGGHDFDSFINGVGAIAMGSTTYQWIYDHQIANEPGKLQPWPYKVPTWVFSTRQLPVIPNVDIRFVSGDVKPVHQAMSTVAGDKNIWIMGGGEMAGKFYDAKLLNELIIQIAPVTLNGGAPLFPRTTHPPMRLISAKPIGGLFVELHYEVPL
jgi:dihydrofolate reductase